MSAPATPAPAPASTAAPASGSPPSVLQWIPSILLLMLIYAFLAAQAETPSVQSILIQGLPIVFALSIAVRVLTGNTRYWHKAATAAMGIWLLGVVVPLFQRGESAATQAIYNQSERLGKSTDAAKEKFYLNRSADIHPSLLAAREQIFDQVLQMEEVMAEKTRNKLEVMNELYLQGRMSLEDYQHELMNLKARVERGDQIHASAMQAAKGPEPPEQKKPYPPPFGIPHWVWLGYVVVVGIIAWQLVHDTSTKLVTLLLAAVASLFCIRGISWSWPDFSGISNFFVYITEDFVGIIIGFIVLLCVAWVLFSLMPKSSGGGGHHGGH